MSQTHFEKFSQLMANDPNAASESLAEGATIDEGRAYLSVLEHSEWGSKPVKEAIPEIEQEALVRKAFEATQRVSPPEKVSVAPTNQSGKAPKTPPPPADPPKPEEGK